MVDFNPRTIGGDLPLSERIRTKALELGKVIEAEAEKDREIKAGTLAVTVSTLAESYMRSTWEEHSIDPPTDLVVAGAMLSEFSRRVTLTMTYEMSSDDADAWVARSRSLASRVIDATNANAWVDDMNTGEMILVLFVCLHAILTPLSESNVGKVRSAVHKVMENMGRALALQDFAEKLGEAIEEEE